MTLRSEFISSVKKPERVDGLKFRARKFARLIENSPGPGDVKGNPTGVQAKPGRGVSGESSN